MKKAYACIVINLFVLSLTQKLNSSSENKKKYAERCKDFAKNPYFESDLVVGKPWRVYYTWNINMDVMCFDILFKNATPAIIHRFWSDMNEYLEQQPYWESASLVMSSGGTRGEVLLLPAPGAAGGFLGVPNVIRSGGMTPMRGGVPLLHFQLKLVRDGKYLVMMDCLSGVTTLSARRGHPPYRAETVTLVAELGVGDGFPACVAEKNKSEQFLV